MDNRDRQLAETERLQQVISVVINFELVVAVRQVQSRHVWDVLVSSFTLFLLKLEGDTSNWALLDTLHQMGGVTSDLVSETLGWDVSNFTGETLVGFKVEGEFWVVTLDHLLSSSLDGFSSDATHLVVLLALVGECRKKFLLYSTVCQIGSEWARVLPTS